ncbi:response regulator [Aquabacterium soli]|uniref:Response regulator n=1 Tax=Aquabacterium soli TaxID=2493092 RepID=A0A426VAI7_9BURK|nr:response regulator [Aquabacterium soli]RRS03926.1 response regulator [Aquabacterium soli]
MSADFAEIFTVAARHAVPMVRAKGLRFSFDCQTDGIVYVGDAPALQGALHRLICTVVETMATGSVLISAQMEGSPEEPRRVGVSIGGVGQCDEARLAMTVQRLGLALNPVGHNGTPEYAAQGMCPLTQGRVELHCLPSQGLLVSLELTSLAPGPESADPPAHASGARAWLVNVDDLLGNSWKRRLQRLGWAVSIFPSLREAAVQLGEQPHAAKPSLVLLMERDGSRRDCSMAFAAELPASAQLVYAVQAASRNLKDSMLEGFQMRVYPFSPDDLDHFTCHANGADLPSGTTRPMPLTLDHMPVVLIVDDQPLNLVIGRGLMEALGYFVHTASSAVEAIARCRTEAPDVVLMDVRMPSMDGLAATAELRGMQLKGLIPPFPIIAFTASWSHQVREECLAAGMDECLPKPLEIGMLARELHRFCAMH